MRVAYVGSLERGGPPDLAAALAVAIAEDDDTDVRVFAPPPTRGSATLDGLLEPTRIDSWAETLEVRRRVAAWQPDLVHFHDRRASLVAAAFTGRRQRPALVLTYHGVPEDVSAAWFDGARSAAPPTRYTQATLAADALVLRALDRVVVPSLTMARFLRERLKAPSLRIQHIDNGLPLPPARPRDRPVRTLLFVGLLLERKGLLDLLEALARPDVMPEDARLLIAGEGPERAAVERRVADPVLAGRVSLLGFRTDIDDLLEQADALVLPSRMEQQPLALVQAMAAGRPVLATRCGGVPEMVAGLPAVLAEPDDVADLARALRRLFADSDPGRTGELLAEGAHGMFSIDRAVDAHRALYADLVGSRSSRDQPEPVADRQRRRDG